MSTNKSVSGESNQTIAKSASIIGFATLCSRLLGFARDVVIARLFGVYVYAQAFVIAFRIPNLLRDFVGEGATNAAFVPVFTEYTVKHSKEEFWELVNVVLNLLLVILMAITLLGVILSPLIVRLIAPGFIADPDKLTATVRLTRIIFPYILLISLAAYSMGILNSLRHFAVPALAPCLLNISIIVFALLFGEGIKGLALGVLVGGVLQLAVQVPVLYKKGFRLALFKKFKHPAAKTIGRLMLPRVFSSCIYQLNNFVDSIFGSLAWIVGEGGVAILYFAYRLVLFPIGIFSTALSQAILPAFSTQALTDNQDKLKQTLTFGLRVNFFLLLPASIGFMALAHPIISTLFRGGRFDAYSARMTSDALFFYSIGLFAYGATRILQSCFFALKDTVTPAKVAGLGLAINVVLNSLLMFPLKTGGLALATSISGIITFGVLFSILKKRLKPFSVRAIFDSFIRVLAASLGMGMVCYFLSERQIVLCNSALARFLNLGFTLIAGFAAYALFCFIFRVPEIRQLWQWLTRKSLD
jgi:putative peptidoglycan lipid II flippase